MSSLYKQSESLKTEKCEHFIHNNKVGTLMGKDVFNDDLKLHF